MVRFLMFMSIYDWQMLHLWLDKPIEKLGPTQPNISKTNQKNKHVDQTSPSAHAGFSKDGLDPIMVILIGSNRDKGQ